MKVSRLVTLLLLFVLVGSALVTAKPVRVNAQNEPPAPAPTSQTPATADVSYQYVAQAGDSFTTMARKAVQTYGLKYKVNLSHAKIIFAETNLTNEAGSPLLNLSQPVAMKESALKAWIDKAAKLTPEQEAAWQYYVPFVDFNTNSVGQAK